MKNLTDQLVELENAIAVETNPKILEHLEDWKSDVESRIADMDRHDEMENFDPHTSLFIDETDMVVEDPYFDNHTFSGPY